MALASSGVEIPEHPAPIVGFAPFEPDRLRAMHAHMREAGIIAPLIAYPGGATALYFRLIVTSEHTASQIEQLGDALRAAVRDTAKSIA
jgi:7-keto-8-aminopelargonate synthetase-like enzyme